MNTPSTVTQVVCKKSILFLSAFAVFFIVSSPLALAVDCINETTPTTCQERREEYRDCIDWVEYDDTHTEQYRIFCYPHAQFLEGCTYCQALCGPGGEQTEDQCGLTSPSE